MKIVSVHCMRFKVYFLNECHEIFLAANLRRTQLRSELNEIEGQHDSTNSENVALKRDKLLLTDEVANLNAKV